MKAAQLAFEWKDLGQKYVTLLERDLELERERNKELREDLKFYRGKCERLELALMSQAPIAAGQEYVRRSEPAKPPLHKVKLESAMKPMFSELKRKWNSLTAEEQDAAVEKGWNLEQEQIESEVTS